MAAKLKGPRTRTSLKVLVDQVYSPGSVVAPLPQPRLNKLIPLGMQSETRNLNAEICIVVETFLELAGLNFISLIRAYVVCQVYGPERKLLSSVHQPVMGPFRHSGDAVGLLLGKVWPWKQFT